MEFFVSFLATVVLTPIVIRVSGSMGLVDQPSNDILKIHKQPTPRSGGIPLAAGLIAALLVVRPSAALLVAAFAALTIGLIDDLLTLSAGFRLAAETLLALGTSILALGAGSWPLVLFGTAMILVAINAANLFDGMDGLLSGAGLISAAGLAILSTGASAGWLWALAGALAGFLVHNRPPARIFLGDGGAYVVGATLGVSAVQLLEDPPRALGGMLAFGLIGLDLILTVIRRVRDRQSLFIGDRSHIYDQLTRRGFSVWRTLAILWTLQTLLVAAGLLVAPLTLTLALAASVVLLLLSLLAAQKMGFIRTG